MEKLNVAIADDNDRMVHLLSDIVKSDAGLQIVGTAKDGEEAYNLIKSKELPPDILYEKKQTKLKQIKLLKESFSVLNEREKDVLLNRKLTENPMTLQDLSVKYNVSMERVRQIEEQAIKKIQNFILTKSN